jgi:hypothetical protein
MLKNYLVKFQIPSVVGGVASAIRRVTSTVARRSYIAGTENALLLEQRYPRSLSTLHWAIGLSIVGCIATVTVSQKTDKENKEKKARLMHVHKSLALIVAALVPVRIAIRLTSKMPKHILGLSKWEERAGSASHLALCKQKSLYY